MKIHIGTEQGTIRGKKQRLSRIDVCFYEAGEGVQVGPDQDNLQEIDENAEYFTEGELFTGDIPKDFESDWSEKGTISVVQSKPLPMTILGIVPRLVTEDED
jgi:hypothetical protein